MVLPGIKGVLFRAETSCNRALAVADIARYHGDSTNVGLPPMEPEALRAIARDYRQLRRIVTGLLNRGDLTDLRLSVYPVEQGFDIFVRQVEAPEKLSDSKDNPEIQLGISSKGNCTLLIYLASAWLEGGNIVRQPGSGIEYRLSDSGGLASRLIVAKNDYHRQYFGNPLPEKPNRGNFRDFIHDVSYAIVQNETRKGIARTRFASEWIPPISSQIIPAVRSIQRKIASEDIDTLFRVRGIYREKLKALLPVQVNQILQDLQNLEGTHGAEKRHPEVIVTEYEAGKPHTVTFKFEIGGLTVKVVKQTGVNDEENKELTRLWRTKKLNGFEDRVGQLIKGRDGTLTVTMVSRSDVGEKVTVKTGIKFVYRGGSEAKALVKVYFTDNVSRNDETGQSISPVTAISAESLKEIALAIAKEVIYF